MSDTKDLTRELVTLLLKSNSIIFNNNHEKTDEILPPEAKFRLNFDNLFQNYRGELTDIFVEAVATTIYKKYGVDVIFGIGNSGTMISVGSDVLVERLKEDDRIKIKNYRWGYVDKSGNPIGVNLEDGDRIAILDEAGIFYNSLLKGIGDIYKQNVEGLEFVVVLNGLDLGVVDEKTGIPRKDLAARIIASKYNRNDDEVKILSVATIEDVLYIGSNIESKGQKNGWTKIGEYEKEILEEYIHSQKEKLKY